MRLTLRTLLAWLDDTLPPSEVRQIGQQVAESPRAQELVDRIRLVTRQRRLTVPHSSGPEGADPNLVATYLEPDPDPEKVAEYERLALKSDVNLAEVASVHQILSLLGQKAKVPPAARQRMYHLVRGREAVRPAEPRPAAAPKAAPPVEVHSWTLPEHPKRSLVERFGPLAAVAALMFLLGWSAWMSLGPPDRPEVGGPLAVATEGPRVPPPPPIEPAASDDPVPAPDPAVATPTEEPRPEAPAEDAMPKAEVAPEPARAADLAPGSAGVVGALEGVLLRFNPDSRAWDRLVAGAALRPGDRLVNLAPFFTPIRVGTKEVTMIGDAEMKVLAPEEGAAARFELVRGRVRARGDAGPEPLAVGFGPAEVRLTVPEGATVGLERVNERTPGEALPSPSALRILAAGGAVAASAGGASETVAAGSSAIFRGPATFAAEAEGAAPAWLAEAAPPAVDQERGKGLASYFKPDRSALLCLVEAAEDENPGIRRYAVTALGAIGPLDLIVSSMSKKGDPETRRAAIAVLREVASRDADSAKALREALEKSGGSEEAADKVESLLVGFTPKELADEATGARLVNLLKESEDVSVRELAIEALQRVSRRGDRLGYDPDKPTENGGLKAWQDLVQRRELNPEAEPAPPPR